MAFWQVWNACEDESNEVSSRRVPISEAEAQRLCDLANSTLGPEMQEFLGQKYIDRLEAAGEAIGWRFDPGASNQRPFRIERPLAKRAKVLRWHAVHASGLGGMFTSALGLIEKCAERF
eukprot:TRINITY_DN35873_c0_g1_i1.p1 TRINITY_DN35873_c0_g1~~TRINITY_DN35873_c0_g1_i1.p1  ORF type:complete len:134 (+),score=33.52 TRINITY_DN35873_c0_g1_i1:48-404(+)